MAAPGGKDFALNAAELGTGQDYDKTKNAKVTTAYRWQEPPISPLGYIFPSDSTYHPLLNNSNYEILYNRAAIEGAQDLSEEEKNKYRTAVEKIVTEAPYIKAMGGVYLFSILAILMLVVMYFFPAMQNTISKYVLIGFMAAAAINGIYASAFAKGVGTQTWVDFTMKLNSSQYSGQSVAKILSDWAQEDASTAAMNKFGSINPAGATVLVNGVMRLIGR
jgi:hypothetical protein